MNSEKTTSPRLEGGPAAVLFDMDGVVADTRHAHRKAWRLFAENLGVTLDVTYFEARTFGRSNRTIFAEFFPELLTSEGEFAARADEKEAFFRELFQRGEAPALPGLRDFVERLHADGVALAIGSSAPRPNIEAVLTSLRLDGFFSVVVCADDVAEAKPDPAIFLRCCKLLGVSPRRTLVLEDSLHGLTAARRAGCLAVGITTMHDAQELRDHCLEAVPDFHALREAWPRIEASFEAGPG